MLGLYALLIAGCRVAPGRAPQGFLPSQDRGFATISIELPGGASLARTTAVVDAAAAIVRGVPGIASVSALAGVSGRHQHRGQQPGDGHAGLRALERAAAAGRDRGAHPARAAAAAGGAGGGGRAGHPAAGGAGPRQRRRLRAAAGGPHRPRHGGAGRRGRDLVLGRAGAGAGGRVFPLPGATRRCSRSMSTAPHRDAGRAASRRLSQSIETLLGSSYVNDFTAYGRNWRVMAQASPEFRRLPTIWRGSSTRNAQGEMVPLANVMALRDITGPAARAALQPLPRSRDRRRDPARHRLGGRAAAMERAGPRSAAGRHRLRMDRPVLRADASGNAGLLVFPLCVLFVYPGAGGAVRLLEPAIRGHPDRADVPADLDRLASGCSGRT